jgi:FAD/FMN-containing dehydrogenase
VASPDSLAEQLAGVVGPEHVLVDPAQRAGFETDWTGRYHGSARLVVRPGDAAELARVLATCHRARVAVVPQGGNTGLVGGSVPRHGEVVLSTRRLDELGVDHEPGEAIVGAGVVLADLRAAATARGWDVGVDLGARGSCTIGGMVATNAGGEHVLRYGPMVEQLLGLEAVLADGTPVGRVPALRKDNTGYHWPGLLAGSEGTLAVVTRVHLRLVPALPARVVALVGVDDLTSALGLAARLRRALPPLHALEVMFADGIELVVAHTGVGAPWSPPAPVVLLVEVAGPAGSTEDLTTALADALAAAPEPRATAVGTDPIANARLWRYREGHTEAINALGVPHKLDVALPFRALAEFERAVRDRVATVAPGARLCLFGHLGDGNLHVNVVGPDPDDDRVDTAVLDLVLALGGSISAEHGIGVAKRAALARSRSAAELAALRRVKAALDPDALLNPGVIFAA